MSNVDSTVEKGAEYVDVVDCGAVSETTQGSWLGVFMEVSSPPNIFIPIFG